YYLSRWWLGASYHRRVRSLVDLLLDGSVERWMSMAMEIHPDGRGPIEKPLSFGIDQVGSFAPLDNERLFLFPFLHLGEGMPEVLVIPVNQLSSRRTLCHGRGVVEVEA